MTAEPSRNPVLKAMTVLRWMVESGPHYLRRPELAEATHLAIEHGPPCAGPSDRAGPHRAGGIGGRYAISSDLVRLALRITAGLSLRSASLPVMESVARACNETTVLALYNPVKVG